MNLAVLFTMALSLLPLSAPPAATEVAAPARHCQVPCGIYGDRMRIDMMMEDAATIAKAMARIAPEAQAGNWNQVVRWVQNKEKHAEHIQEIVASYWLAQRIKAPKNAEEAEVYAKRLSLLHQVTVLAMKCKQTTDTKNVESLKELVLKFSKSYFSKEDLKHIEEHHGGHGHGK